MAYCVKCGEKVEDTAAVCPACGAAIPGGETVHDHGYSYGNAEAYSGGQSAYNTYYSGQDKDGYFPESEVDGCSLLHRGAGVCACSGRR